jgi:hypothetical protein
LTSPPEYYLRPHTRVPETPRTALAEIPGSSPGVQSPTAQPRRAGYWLRGCQLPDTDRSQGFSPSQRPLARHVLPATISGRSAHGVDHLSVLSLPGSCCTSSAPACPLVVPYLRRHQIKRPDNSQGRDFRALLPPVSRTAPTPTRRKALPHGTDAPVVQPLQSLNPSTRRPHLQVASSPPVLPYRVLTVHPNTGTPGVSSRRGWQGPPDPCPTLLRFRPSFPLVR